MTRTEDATAHREFADAATWEAWLSTHHETDARPGAWLRIARKSSPLTTVTAAQALEVALCYGWIDSQRKSFDQHSFLQRYSRRRRNSPWSRVNVERAEALTTAGRMRPPGLTQIATAQADGRWDAAYTAQRDAPVPPDLADALAAHPAAAARFEALGKTGRYRLVLPLLKARTPTGRTNRLDRALAELLEPDR